MPNGLPETATIALSTAVTLGAGATAVLHVRPARTRRPAGPGPLHDTQKTAPSRPSIITVGLRLIHQSSHPPDIPGVRLRSPNVRQIRNLTPPTSLGRMAGGVQGGQQAVKAGGAAKLDAAASRAHPADRAAVWPSDSSSPMVWPSGWWN